MRPPRRHQGPVKDRYVSTKGASFRIFFTPFMRPDELEDPNWPDGGTWEFEPRHVKLEYWRGSDLYPTAAEAARACIEMDESGEMMKLFRGATIIDDNGMEIL
jgi:hypothetical protein